VVVGLGFLLDPPSARPFGCLKVRGEAAQCFLLGPAGARGYCRLVSSFTGGGGRRTASWGPVVLYINGGRSYGSIGVKTKICLLLAFLDLAWRGGFRKDPPTNSHGRIRPRDCWIERYSVVRTLFFWQFDFGGYLFPSSVM
jgi:hypothetical protein